MTDIVQRLRRIANAASQPHSPAAIAADEIEQLRAWKAEAAASWQGLVELVRPGDLGRMWPEVVADEIEGLRTTVAEDLRYQRKLEAEVERLRAENERLRDACRRLLPQRPSALEALNAEQENDR